MGDESKPMETELTSTDQSNSTAQASGGNSAMDTTNGGGNTDGMGEPNQAAPSGGGALSNDDAGTQPTAAAVKKEIEGTPTAQQPHSLLQAMSTRQYLDTTVVPILLQALQALAKERPTEPIDYIINFLAREKSKFGSVGAAATGAAAGQQAGGGAN